MQLAEARARYEEFCIPICILPATISNNVPGTDLSIGADTSLNAIVEVRRQVRQRMLLGWENREARRGDIFPEALCFAPLIGEQAGFDPEDGLFSSHKHGGDT